MTDVVAILAIVATLIIALVTIARENRYRFIDRKLDLYTELTHAAEVRHDVIRWQLADQASEASAGRLARDARIRTIPHGDSLERARSAIRLATRSKDVDDAAEAFLIAASDLGQVAYIAPADDEVVPAVDRAKWEQLEARYTAAWSRFIAVAKDDIDTAGNLWQSPW